MKKILFLGILLIDLALATPPETKYFSNFEFVNYENIPKACETIMQLPTFDDGANCDNDFSIYYRSPLDSTVSFGFMFYENSIWINRNTQVCEGDAFGHVTVGQSGTLQFSEVFLAEFLRLQELGVVNMEKDSAESFILSVIDSLKMGNGGECDIDMAYGTGHMLPNYSCCSLVETPSAIPLHSFVQNHLHSTKISQGKFRIDGADLGTPYRLFDLNGKLLRSGVLQSREVTTPSSPAILDIAGKRLLLK
ncbi:MAG: hypothetical protein ACI38O_07395 [Fibrobacter intestinalis]|uniref:hypothetical protein n=1 Tax=Fibrobacter intestinalis TaxID=28122 RepID=UPI003F0FC8D6